MNNLPVVVELLNNGADFNLMDKTGKSAFEHYHQDNSNSHEEVCKRIVDVFKRHALKLASQNLYVDNAILSIIKDCVQPQVRLSIEEKCNEELGRLREPLLPSCSITLSDFLSETKAVVNFPRLPLNDQDNINEFFAKKQEYLRNNYPQLAGIIILQHRKALKRVSIIPRALQSVQTLVGFPLPHICCDIIFQFLSYENLNNLIRAVET